MVSSPERFKAVRPAVWLSAALVAASFGVVLFCFDPGQFHFYPVCFFHKTTGLLCPGCGCLRAMHELLHGHIGTAFRFNPLLIVSLPFLAWFGANYALQRGGSRSETMTIRPIWIWIFLIAAMAFGVMRNLPGTPLAMLPQ
jgi:hypothetical protein